MPPFFRKSIDQHQYVGSHDDLDVERLHFKQNQISGLFEIHAKPEELELLVLGDGEETGVYRLEGRSRAKISLADIGPRWETPQVPIRSVALPDQASRALWQAMEFQVASQEELADMAGWKAFLGRCYSERLSAMVGLASDLGDGFVFLHEGIPASNETVFCSSDGFTSNLQVVENCLEPHTQLTLYKVDPATQAFQCTLLRLGVIGWGVRILANYKEMVGQKLLQILNANLNATLMHQQSNIYLADINIVDNHFFCECNAAAQTYQILLQNMSQYIGRVVGGVVTRRILHTTFERLALSEQEVLTTHTLAPAAFLR